VAAIAEAELLARQFDATQFDDRLVDCARSELLIRQGRLADARAIRDKGRPVGTSNRKPEANAESFVIAYEALVEARLTLAEGDTEGCIALSERLATEARDRGRLITVLDAELLVARARWQCEEIDAAFGALDQALSVAGPEGIVQRFVDEGPEMARILYEARVAGNSDPFIGTILAKFPLEEQSSAAASVHEAESIDALSARELEVLTLLSRGLSNKEAASELCVSVRTVKWHTSHIYAKLGVTSRTQAIARARQLGILPD
jgi:LuxR family maltose regulon positive regulatory protein